MITEAEWKRFKEMGFTNINRFQMKSEWYTKGGYWNPMYIILFSLHNDKTVTVMTKGEPFQCGVDDHDAFFLLNNEEYGNFKKMAGNSVKALSDKITDTGKYKLLNWAIHKNTLIKKELVFESSSLEIE